MLIFFSIFLFFSKSLLKYVYSQSLHCRKYIRLIAQSNICGSDYRKGTIATKFRLELQKICQAHLHYCFRSALSYLQTPQLSTFYCIYLGDLGPVFIVF